MALNIINGPRTSAGNLYLSKVNDMSCATVDILSIGTGNTIKVEQSDDNVTFTEVQSITSKGKYTFDVSSYIYFRVRVSTYSAGTVWVEVEEGQAPLPPAAPTPQIGVQLTAVTTTQRDAIASPATGLAVFNTTTAAVDVYDGTDWLELAVVA